MGHSKVMVRSCVVEMGVDSDGFFCCDVGFFFFLNLFYFIFNMSFCSGGILVGSGGMVGMVEARWW